MEGRKYGIDIFKNIPINKKFQAIIVAVAHNEFISLKKSDWENMSHENRVLIDIKNILPNDIECIRL